MVISDTNFANNLYKKNRAEEEAESQPSLPAAVLGNSPLDPLGTNSTQPTSMNLKFGSRILFMLSMSASEAFSRFAISVGVSFG